MASSAEDNECKGIFGTCISPAGMVFVLIAIIMAGALVLALPVTHCIIKDQRLGRANRLRNEAIQLQQRHRVEAPDGIHDINGNEPVFMASPTDLRGPTCCYQLLCPQTKGSLPIRLAVPPALQVQTR